MTDAMAHRGPDDRGRTSLQVARWASRRLSVVDVAGGHQPFANEHGDVWAVQNGELYNHDELRARARAAAATASRRGATPRSCRTSTKSTAPSFAEHLRGMFGVAVWDERARRAVLARDRLGVKPLYYARARRAARLRVGAEEPPRERSRRAELDYDAIDTYLTLGFVPGAVHTPLARRPQAPARATGSSSRTAASAIERYWRYPEPASRRRR